MTTTTATNPVQEGLYTILSSDSTLTALALVRGTLPEESVYPAVWIEVSDENDDLRGFGLGGLPTITVRTHVFTKLDLTTAHTINARIVALLKDQPVAATGYQQCGLITYKNTLTLPLQNLDGDRVSEVVSVFTIWMEQQ